jgi:CDP-paratose 2-epimerase
VTPVTIVTGAGGLVGSQTVEHFATAGNRVIGIDNDMRSTFFGPHASTRSVTERLCAEYDDYRVLDIDIRDRERIDRLFAEQAGDVELVVHAAAQPSHDWAAQDPIADFQINANGTLNLLEATRNHCPDASFVYLSTNKVYGDTPNRLPLLDAGTRYELPRGHRYYEGIDTSMSIDRTLHSLFGVSKASADLMVQEYGRYFGMPTVCIRGGCLTGPNHAGAQLHGFLSYLMRCTVMDEPYTIFGYAGKQVRDNIHSADLIAAIAEFHKAPRSAAVYNVGGGREGSCSVLEAISLCEEISGRQLRWELSDQARVGDHAWWISDLRQFQADYPDWSPSYGLDAILREIYESNVERWAAAG